MITNELSKWLNRADKKKISKSHLARKIGVSRSYITKLEKGNLQPSAGIMFKIADYFGCRVEDIFIYAPDSK